MAAYRFNNATATGVGTAGTDVYSASAKCILIGLSITNITRAALPVEVEVVKANGSTVHLTTSGRIAGGVSVDVLSGRKLVLMSQEKVRITSKVDNAFDCVASILEDVD
ncbi:hypothetical protein [Vulcanococcus sp.]|uniref:hypothetical protein n=1 Tax=Vulcanococcus sp. TaxID=2856995 RepID=UPI003BFC52FD